MACSPLLVQRDSNVWERTGQERGEEASEDTCYINALGKMSTGGWSHPLLSPVPGLGLQLCPCLPIPQGVSVKD